MNTGILARRLAPLKVALFLVILTLSGCDNEPSSMTAEDKELAELLLKEILPFEIPIPGGSCGVEPIIIEQTPEFTRLEYDFDNVNCDFKGKFQVELGTNYSYRKDIYLNIVDRSAEQSGIQTIGGSVTISPSNDDAPVKSFTAEFTVGLNDVLTTHVINELSLFSTDGLLVYHGLQKSIFHFSQGPTKEYDYQYLGVTKRQGCAYPSSGQISITSPSLNNPVELDFDNGSCDKVVTVTINGRRGTFKLQ